MGYCVELLDSNFKIRKEDFPRALRLVGRMTEGVTIRDVLSDLGLDVEIDEFGICSAWWDGDKYRDCIETELARMASVISDDSYLDFIGEDNCIWRLSFRNGEMEILNGTIVFSQAHHPREMAEGGQRGRLSAFSQ